jgi:hypothetical protein
METLTHALRKLIEKKTNKLPEKVAVGMILDSLKELTEGYEAQLAGLEKKEQTDWQMELAASLKKLNDKMAAMRKDRKKGDRPDDRDHFHPEGWG